MMDEVTQWLDNINMSDYASKFEEHGLDRMSIIQNDMTPIDLFEMGINKPHSNFIMRQAKTMKSSNNLNRSYAQNIKPDIASMDDVASINSLPPNPNNKESIIWQENTQTLKDEFNPELITTFDEIIEMFGNAEQGVLKASLNQDILSNAQQLSDIMNTINHEIKECQYHRKKCQKLYSLILHKKVQLQS